MWGGGLSLMGALTWLPELLAVGYEPISAAEICVLFVGVGFHVVSLGSCESPMQCFHTTVAKGQNNIGASSLIAFLHR